MSIQSFSSTFIPHRIALIERTTEQVKQYYLSLNSRIQSQKVTDILDQFYKISEDFAQRTAICVAVFIYLFTAFIFMLILALFAIRIVVAPTIAASSIVFTIITATTFPAAVQLISFEQPA